MELIPQTIFFHIIPIIFLVLFQNKFVEVCVCLETRILHFYGALQSKVCIKFIPETLFYEIIPIIFYIMFLLNNKKVHQLHFYGALQLNVYI